jgi:K+-transporting ATPase c subunit
MNISAILSQSFSTMYYQNPLPKANSPVENLSEAATSSYPPKANSVSDMIDSMNRSLSQQASNNKYSTTTPYLPGSILDTKA